MRPHSHDVRMTGMVLNSLEWPEEEMDIVDAAGAMTHPRCHGGEKAPSPISFPMGWKEHLSVELSVHHHLPESSLAPHFRFFAPGSSWQIEFRG